MASTTSNSKSIKEEEDRRLRNPPFPSNPSIDDDMDRSDDLATDEDEAKSTSWSVFLDIVAANTPPITVGNNAIGSISHADNGMGNNGAPPLMKATTDAAGSIAHDSGGPPTPTPGPSSRARASKKDEKNVENEDYCWPDPGPRTWTHTSQRDDHKNGIDEDHRARINDVSRMSSYPNGTPVSRIFYPRCEEDVVCILRAARDANKCVGIRGTKHSMGGHSIASRSGWEIDSKLLRHIQYDGNNEPDVVRCGPGCQWSDIIKVLNAHGKSPRTMQSYCSFSVGGTLAVNAHGVTTDYCFAESVVEMRVARVSTGGKVEVVECKPPSCRDGLSNASPDDEKKLMSGELFSLVLGGYGLFGVITEVVLKVESNVHLELDSMQLNVNSRGSDGNSSEFLRIYDNCRYAMKHNDKEDSLGTSIGKVNIKLARLNTLTIDRASLYVFRTSGPSQTNPAEHVSDLPASPRELSAASRLLYKWALPLLKEKRYAQEENSGKAIDWGSQGNSLTRNQLLYESAVPLSKLYEPLLKKDDTFILQEFFCPHDKMMDWLEAVTPIYKDIEKQQHTHGQDLMLLNTTIRYVEQDDITFLSYSRVPGGVFAFVLYYRIKRDAMVEKRLGDFHNRFAKTTISLGGTFYLPYRSCYSAELLKAAYPMIQDFALKKEQFDPDCLFSNLWFEQYVLPLCSEDYKLKWSMQHEHKKGDHVISEQILAKTHEAKTKQEFLEWLPRKEHPCILRRTNSYRSLLRSKELRDQFREQFLVQIFNVADPDEVMRLIARAAWDPANHNDVKIYKFIYHHFQGEPGQSGTNVSKTLLRYWRGIQQLRQQKEELSRQTLNILMRLEKMGKINDYVCIGDHGKTVSHFVSTMQMNGKIWVVHNSEDVVDKYIENTNSLPSLGTVLERGSLDPVAHEEILYDYCSDPAREKFRRIPTNTVDLVTINQGLHHIPPGNLFEFLMEVKRILRPDGIFIIREHDLQMSSDVGKASYPMLDIAHSIFNAVTGVPVKAEAEEIRAFRPITEWRAILAKIGFTDTMVSEVEDGDPTWDEMLAFKLSASNHGKISSLNGCSIAFPRCTSFNSKDPPMLSLIRTVLGQIPASTAKTVDGILSLIQQWLPVASQHLRGEVLNEIPNLLKEFGIGLASHRINALLDMKLVATIDQMTRIVEGALSLLSQSEIQKFYNFKNLVNMPELFLILPYLQRKVEINGDDSNEIEKMLVTFVENHFPLLLFEEKKKGDCKSGDPHDHSIVSSTSTNIYQGVASSEVTELEVREVIERVAVNIPGLLDPDIFLVESGFTLTQQTSLIAKFGGEGISAFSRNVAGFLDRQTFEEMKIKIKLVEERRDLPTRDRLFSSSGSHPWYLVMKTFMKSPKVVLENRAIFGLKMIGLGEVETLYKAAKQEQSQGPTEQLRFESDVVTYLRSLDQSLEALGSKWTNDVVERKIMFDGSAQTSLCDVAEVLSARFGYKSLTSRMVDVTRQLQELHSRVHAKIANPKYECQNVPENVQLGWLPIKEQILIEMRFRGSTKKEVGDVFRKRLVKGATFGLAGTNQLIIKYRRIVQADKRNHIPIPDSVHNALRSGLVENIADVCKSLGNFLESKNLIQKDLHPSDGHYTFFKLNEWMQVEILEELVDSLSHTPWYQFPFMSFLSTYFDVFRQQCQIVQRKYGILTAYSSEAFFVDFIPGLVMSFLFGQLQLLAVPLKMMTPPDGYAGLDQGKFLEEILLHVHLPMLNDDLKFFKDEVDGNISKVRLLPGNFVIITTPPFKAMGEVLMRVATRFPAARVFQISNQQEVQVRISRTHSDDTDRADANDHDQDLERISALPRVERLMQYQFPNTNLSDGAAAIKRMKRHYCFQVHCLSLLDVVRTCRLLPTHEVEQIYDFWN